MIYRSEGAIFSWRACLSVCKFSNLGKSTLMVRNKFDTDRLRFLFGQIKTLLAYEIFRRLYSVYFQKFEILIHV